MHDTWRNVPSRAAKIEQFIVETWSEMTLKLHQRVRAQVWKTQFIKLGKWMLSRHDHTQRLTKRRRRPKPPLLEGIAEDADIYLSRRQEALLLGCRRLDKLYLHMLLLQPT
ncbi:hypothetical protein XI06_13340 [Bradyrhizobium sp. CCBAU 11434]|nr:hypothetical protein [Bradyrhizobium sp. CCBAU 11434]